MKHPQEVQALAYLEVAPNPEEAVWRLGGHLSVHQRSASPLLSTRERVQP